MNEQQINEAPPRKAYDTEYGTQWRKEYQYLQSRGIKAAFVKTNEYGIRTYKYKKTAELFFALSQFYVQVEHEKMYNELTQLLQGRATNEAEAEEILQELMLTSVGGGSADAD